jgi:hypothetical protein
MAKRVFNGYFCFCNSVLGPKRNVNLGKKMLDKPDGGGKNNLFRCRVPQVR